MRFDSSTSFTKVVLAKVEQPVARKEWGLGEGGKSQAGDRSSRSVTPRSSFSSTDASVEDGEWTTALALTPMKKCGQFVKAFYAALPVGQLDQDIEKGLVKDTGVAIGRLQVDVHSTLLRVAA